MFTSLHPDSSFKQPVAFIASLGLQFAVLVVLSGGPFPQISGPSVRPNAAHSTSTTTIYFHKDAIAAPSTPAPAASPSHLAPEPTSEPKLAADVDTQADPANANSGTEERQVLTPFPSWSMKPRPSGFTVFGHQIKTALPVFTPDPPILHGEAPELARGKDLVLEVVIDDHGSIVQVEILQAVGYGVENSIMPTLRRWIFVPAKVNGIAISSRRQLRFHFPG
jgi:hypothetical protein